MFRRSFSVFDSDISNLEDKSITIFRSTGPALTLNFVTDEFVTSPGFMVEWAETLGPAQGCGGVIDLSQSPSGLTVFT